MGGQVIDTGSDAILEKGVFQGKAQSVLELLQYKGEVSDKLRETILPETDGNTLSKWLQLSAKVYSIEEFIEQMNQE